MIARLTFLSIVLASTSLVIPSDDINAFADNIRHHTTIYKFAHGVYQFSAGIVVKGQLKFQESFGVSDDDVFKVGEISNSLTSFAVLKLAKSNILSLDETVVKVLTENGASVPSALGTSSEPSPITVRMLLSHSSGFSPRTDSGVHPSQSAPSVSEFLSSSSKCYPPITQLSAPGSQSARSGANYALLQLVIEAVTKQPFDKFMRDEVLQPLGMANSSFVWREGLSENLVVGHHALGFPFPDYRFSAVADVGLYTTVKDMAAFIGAVASGAGGLSKEDLSVAFDSQGKSYGLGFEIIKNGGKTFFGHGGSGRGWKSVFVGDASGDGLVILTGSDGGKQFSEYFVCRWLAWKNGQDLDECAVFTANQKPMIFSAYVLIAIAAFTLVYPKNIFARLFRFIPPAALIMVWIAAMVVHFAPQPPCFTAYPAAEKHGAASIYLVAAIGSVAMALIVTAPQLK
jgi:CubicO group peptidase (beta-lactamase class C family)